MTLLWQNQLSILILWNLRVHFSRAENLHLDIPFSHCLQIMWPYHTFGNKIPKILFFPKIKVFTLDDTCFDAQIAFNVQSWSRRALKPHSTSIILKDNFLHHKFFVRMLNPCTYAYIYPLEKGQFFPLHQGHKESVSPSLWVQNEW